MAARTVPSKWELIAADMDLDRDEDSERLWVDPGRSLYVTLIWSGLLLGCSGIVIRSLPIDQTTAGGRALMLVTFVAPFLGLLTAFFAHRRLGRLRCADLDRRRRYLETDDGEVILFDQIHAVNVTRDAPGAESVRLITDPLPARLTGWLGSLRNKLGDDDAPRGLNEKEGALLSRLLDGLPEDARVTLNVTAAFAPMLAEATGLPVLLDDGATFRVQDGGAWARDRARQPAPASK